MNPEKETYVRRRAFNKIHVTSWLIYLEKDGFVRCPFQKCNFMAFDVNEMCEHYGFCKGDTNLEAKYVCEVCNTCTVSEKRLNEHRSQAHHITVPSAETAAEPEPAEPCKPSKVLMLSWGFFFDKHNYIKCSNCQYIANTMSEMCHHYLVCKQEKKFLRYVCPECKGRSLDVAPLLQHLLRAHSITKRPDQFNHISRNMVQFWEKELREEKYATCLHINSNKERDCLYIDVDLLGINEHSQTCKGPKHITSAKQWFCQSCQKWTNSEEKLIKHELLSHYKMSNSGTQEENEKADHQLRVGETVSSPETIVLKQLTQVKRGVPFQSKETTKSSVKGSPVKPCKKTVIIVKKDIDAGKLQRTQNTPERKNNCEESYSGLQNGTTSVHNLQSISSSVKRYNGEKSLQNSMRCSKRAEKVNNEHQEIFLDLVEDKLVARSGVGDGEKSNDIARNIPGTDTLERTKSLSLTLPSRTFKRDKRFEDQAIEIIDIAESEFVAGKYEVTKSNKGHSETIEPGMIKIEEDFGFDEEYEVHELNSLQGSKNSGCIRDGSSNLLYVDRNTNLMHQRLSDDKNLFQDDTVIEIDDDTTTAGKYQAKEVCKNKENLICRKREESIPEKIRKLSFNLFKDDFSSDEEGYAEMCIKQEEKEEDIKPTNSWQLENQQNNSKTQKNYTRRKSVEDKIERCLPLKPTNSQCNQINHTIARHCSSDLEDAGSTTCITYKGRKSCDSHYQSQMEPKKSLVFQSRLHNFDDMLDEASKNSEKNDKLMLKENYLKDVNTKHPSLSDMNKIIPHDKESVLGVEKLITSVHHFDQTSTTDLAKCDNESNHQSFGNIKFSRTKLVLDKCNEHLEKVGLEQDYISNNESRPIILDTEKSTSPKSSQNSEEPIQESAIKYKNCVDLVKYKSGKETKFDDNISSLKSMDPKNSSNSEVAATKENYEVSKEPKLVSFFYSGKLNKPFLGSNTSNDTKSSENSKLSTDRSLIGNKSSLSPNEPSSSKHQFVDEPLNRSSGSDHYSEKKQEINKDKLGDNSLNSDPKMDIVSRIQADFLVDSSSDEEVTVTKPMRDIKSENKAVKTQTVEGFTSKNPVALKTGSISVGMTGESMEKNVTEPERNAEVRRISSDFYEESSLDEEDFLGTDEELDMKDHFFNGFQEMAENYNSKSRRFRQFLNRLSESENEEWYVNAGNLSMDVRKDINLPRSEKVALTNNYEDNSLKSFSKEITVIVVDDDSNDIEHNEEQVSVSLPNSKSKLKINNDIKYRGIHNKYIHKKGFMGDKYNMNEKVEIFSEKGGNNFETSKEMLIDSPPKENRPFSCSESKPKECLKVSLSIDRLNLTGKERTETIDLKEAEENRSSETAEVFKVNANNNSVGKMFSENEDENKKESAVVEQLTNSPGHNNDERIEKQPVIATKLGNEVGGNSNEFKTPLENHNTTNYSQCDTIDISDKPDLNNKNSVSREQKDYSITENSACSEVKVNNKKEISSLSRVIVINSENGSNEFDTTNVNQTCKYPENSPEIKNSLSLTESLPKPSDFLHGSSESITSKSGDNLDRLACSTPLKPTEIPFVNSPKTCSSSSWEEETNPNSYFDCTALSDDEPLSVIQKTSQSSIKAVLCSKDNLLTEGFSPHVHSQENNAGQEKNGEEKQDHSMKKSKPAVEATHNNNIDGINLKTDSINVMKFTKKRGRKPKINQSEFKTEHDIINSDNGDSDIMKRNEIGKLEDILSEGSNNNDTAIDGIYSLGEKRLAFENSVGAGHRSFPETPAPVKRRGRPPKRRNKEMSTNKNKGEDFDTLFGLASKNELLVSIYSEEIENIMNGRLSESSKNENNEHRTESGVIQSVQKENELVHAPTENLSILKLNLQTNTVPGSSEIRIPKKRGRKPKLKPETNTFECTADFSTDNIFLDKGENCQNVVHDLSTDTLNETGKLKVPKRRGRKPKIKLERNSSDCTLDTAISSVSDVGSQSNNENSQDADENLLVEKQLEADEIKVPKKRGRKPKLKMESNSSECSLDTANSSTNDVVLQHFEGNCQDIVKDISVENVSELHEIKVPKKRGRKPKLKLENSSECSFDLNSITDDIRQNNEENFEDGAKEFSTENLCDSSEVRVPKKRGRKPKIKLESTSSECTLNMDNSSKKEEVFQNDGCRNFANAPATEGAGAITVPKKRGRPAKSKEIEQKKEVEEVIPKKRGCKSGSKVKLDSTLNQRITTKKNGIMSGKLENQPLSRKRKLESDLNDTSSEVSVMDVDCNNSVTSELHGKDVILINEEKLHSSLNKRARRYKEKPTKLEVSDDNDSDEFEPDHLSSSEDSDDDISFKTPRQSNKRRKIDSDEADDSETVRKTPTRNKKKSQPKTPREKVFFQIKHKASDKVVCGACKQEMTYKNYKSHVIFKHYMLSWLEGEENPVDMKDQKDIENRLMFAKRSLGKTPFRCSVCNMPKLSAVGFYSHILFCGKDDKEKEALLVTCEVCGTRLMPSSFRAHMNMQHTARPTASPGAVVDTVLERGVRSAAARAVEVMQQSQADNQDGEEGSRPGSPDRKSRLSHLYVRPSKIVPALEFKRWKDSLTTQHVVTCAVEGCNFTADSTIGFRKHFFSCPLGPPRLYKCRVCNFTSKEEEGMLEHVEDHEGFIQASDESSDESDGEHKDKHSKHYFFGSSLPFKFLKAVKLMSRTGRYESKKKFFTPALMWTLNLRKSMLASEPLYPEAWPSTHLALAPPDCLPELAESVRFRGTGGEWRTLPRFHSCSVDGVPMLFAGGPVWATAWAPVPDPEQPQYLAVAAHSSAERTHTMASVYSYPGLVQIWALGSLANTDGEGCCPRLVVGLAHRRGPVWGLAWCPAGAYTQERLGLLAAACGDGSVAVYAVPRVTDTVEDPQASCVEAAPVWELRLGCEMMTQCTCVDWHSAAPHSLIAGGFANGMVALWDLTTTSPLLKAASTILPYRVIEAHHSAVTAVQLSCTKENIHMMTASLDRATKFWKLDDSVTLVNYLRKACVTAAVMPNHWLMSISAYDDVYSINSSHVTGCSYRDTFTSSNTNFILQAGTVWGLSFNDWLNGCACASEMGKVNAFFRLQLLVSEDSKKVNKTAFVEDLVSCSAFSLEDDSLVTSGFGPTYRDCASTVGLEFNFEGNSKSPKPSSCSSDNMDSFPIRSFNTVSWNPNMGSFTWLAAGMQCGLVVVPRLSGLRADDLSDLQRGDNR